MTSRAVEQVKEFHRTYGLPIVEEPKLASFERFSLRHGLIFEELNEFADAAYAGDIIGVADALGDLLYVVIGAALEYGIPLDEVVDEIHRSNMSKLDENGQPIYRESDGKVLKGPDYFPPNLKEVLGL